MKSALRLTVAGLILLTLSVIGCGKADPPNRDHIPAIKEQLKGRILLGMETSAVHMMQMAQSEMSYGRQIGEKELIRRIAAVTLDDVLDVASTTLTVEDLSVVSLGPSAAGVKRAFPPVARV